MKYSIGIPDTESTGQKDHDLRTPSINNTSSWERALWGACQGSAIQASAVAIDSGCPG